jgi:hypothetical protein
MLGTEEGEEMTDLPTRCDGGIDWDRIETEGDYWNMISADGVCTSLESWEMVDLAIKQTIERCAKEADMVSDQFARDGSMLGQGKWMAADEIANEIRKLKV